MGLAVLIVTSNVIVYSPFPGVSIYACYKIIHNSQDMASSVDQIHNESYLISLLYLFIFVFI